MPAVPPTLDAVSERPGGRSARVRAAVLTAVRAHLAEDGYGSLSHRAIARRAGVDPTTVYRRWPTRARLALDALVNVAEAGVAVPDTGDVTGDIHGLVDAVGALLADPGTVRMFQALCAAQADDPQLATTAAEFWQGRFDSAAVIIDRAIARGQLPPGTDPRLVLEQAIAPLYFRALLSGQSIGAAFRRRCAERAVAGWSPA